MSSPELQGAPNGSHDDPSPDSQPRPPSPDLDAPSYPELDVSKLQSLPADQQQLYFLTAVSSLTKHVLSLSADDCTAQQFYLKKEVFQILNLASPQPTRVIRNNLGKCLAHIFGRGDRKLLFEAINDLIGIITGGKGKTETSQRMKHAAVVCLGDVFAAAGDSAIGLHPLACTSVLKLLKSSSSNAGLRAAIFSSLAKVVKMIESSIDEAAARDMWKQSRSYATSDKGSLVAVSACRCLRALLRHTSFFENSTDFDKLQTVMFKVMDSSSTQVRHAAAETFAEAMMRGHSASGAPVSPPKGKKTKAKAVKRASTLPSNLADEDEIPTSRPGSPAPGGRRPQDLALTLSDIFKILSTHYAKLSTTNRARASIGVCYGKLFGKLGEKTVETNFLQIIDGLSMDLLGQPNITNNRYRLLISRRIVNTILQDIIGKKILGETGQIAAAKVIVNDIFKNYPQTLPERPEPTKHTLITSLGLVASLTDSLGSAANSFAEACRDGLLGVLQHPSYTVQVHAAACLKALVLACPQQLLPCLSICMNSLNRELTQLTTGRNSPRRCVGFAHGLAATLSASPSRPLYGSVDINSRVLTMATNLLKSSGQSELRVSSTQIQVAWIMIGGLMSLGPNFVKIHLSQLLLLWKNALPKPLSKDNTAHRSFLEASFLTHVRECALGSILAFLQYNSRLLTVDVSKRIATMLQNTTQFLRSLPSKKFTDDVSQRLTPALHLQDLDTMVQRRVLQCYTKLVNLSPPGGSEALLQSNLLTLAVSIFAEPENYAPTSSLSASIANAAATFETVWDVGDNSGFGVTGLVSGFKIRSLPGQHESYVEGTPIEDNSPDDSIDRLLLSPICGALEHDASLLYIGDGGSESNPDPPATEVTNMAIQLFSFVFPLTPPKVQESILEQVRTFMSAGPLQRDPGRKAAMNVNISLAILSTLRVATKETQASPGDVTNLAVERLLQDMLRDFVIDGDQFVRSVGYAAVARLCNACGNAFTNHEIKYLVDTIVANREPSARAGCAMAMGAIQKQVGGMAAGYHLKTVLSVLLSLCNDPHPTVHYWALEALALSADAAGLSFSSYLPGTLGMLVQLYMGDTHNPEVASAVTMNLEMESSTTAAIAGCLDSLINVLGPDLQDSTKSRELILTLLGQFQEEEDLLVQQATLNCLEHLSLYAPGYMEFEQYVKRLQKFMNSDYAALRDFAIDGLHNIMKRDPKDVIQVADEGFEDSLWLVLDTVPRHEGIRHIIRNWVRQSALTQTSGWLDRLQGVLKMTRAKSKDDEANFAAHKATGLPDLRDEEVAGFAASAGATKDDGDTKAASEVEPLRWQVITFAISCIGDLFTLISKDVATKGESPSHAALQARIADVVKMAFSASTSSVVELRIWGLKIIGEVLKMFGRTPDPDFEEAMLLEQYQAQISSALTPAFAADSSPELASEAVNVCAAFISTGIVTDVERMGRILKTLVTGLENFSKNDENASIGELKGLSSNAQVMVKMSVFSAWAELQVASLEQEYLLEVLKPRVGTLTPLWLESLREFARLRFEPDISMTLGPPSLSGSLDTIYAALNRETLLRFYQDSWLNLVDAIASLIEQDSEFVFDALDGKASQEGNGGAPANGGDGNGSSSHGGKGADINYRDEPVAFFFVLFGIAFEALATRPGQTDSLATQEQNLAILQALRKILHPSVSGHAIYREAIFSELMELLDRLVLTEGLDVQAVIVDIARTLCVSHPSARRGDEQTDDGSLSEDVDQLFELTRISVLVLSGLIPNLTPEGQPLRSQMTDEAVLLVRSSLDALVDAAEVFPAIIKTDLHACIVHIFATILAAPVCQASIASQALPTMKRFVASVSASRRTGTGAGAGAGAGTVTRADSSSSSSSSSQADTQLLWCLRRFLSIYLHAQKREAATSLACVKNCLLAIMVLFTGGENHLGANEALVARYLDEVVDCLTDRMTAKIASTCVKSLLLKPDPTPADQTIARYLLPRLIAFVTNTVPEDPEGARGLVAATLAQYVVVLAKNSPPPQQASQQPVAEEEEEEDGDVQGGEGRGAGEQRVAAAVALVLPTLLARASAEGEDTYKETSGRVLEMAGADQGAFRAVVGAMDDAQRTFLEEVIKKGREAAGKAERAASGGHTDGGIGGGQPSIELKMNFGV